MSIRKYKIVNTGDKTSTALGYLNYDEDSSKYSIDIVNGVPHNKLPIVLWLYAEKGKTKIDHKVSKRWVQDRIVPQGRQNIGQILKSAGLEFYDELALLELHNGRCVQDDFEVIRIM